MAYLSLSTANLPDPVIDPAAGKEPADYFVPFIYTGNGADRDIDIGMAPDLVWIKRRNQTGNHMLFDKVRGANKAIYSHLTAAEETLTDRVNSFNSDGWTTGNEDANVSGHTYVAWNWKANGSGVSNTDGSITSTVSANTTSGFSIVKLSDPNNGASYNVGHGLNSPPEMFFIKKTNTTSDWSVYHKDVGNDRRLVLNSTDGQSGSSSVYFGSTTPTSTVVTIGSGLSTGDNWIMYCFHSVDGFSKFGSYVGNGSTDGPFVYTGFRPAFVMIKNANFAEIWPMFDDKRDADNQVENPVYANLSSAEGTASSRGLDFLSNGFKIRGTDTSVNRSGDTHIYMAFAENPFKYSNAR